MASLFFYRDDYVDNPRDAERSNKVVRLWYDGRVRYANEDIADDQCMRIVAERLLVRRLLGLEALDRAYMPKASRVKPFGPNTPMLAELLMPGTFVAMALVPLSPQGLQGQPILARLYCVAGLLDRYMVPLEGNDETALQEFSWFLAGVPKEGLTNGIRGRSWLLAANLLARIVERRDIKTARNLARHYIVTGDVSDGAIRRVEMLRKPELVKRFDSLKWIIPKENDMDIPKMKIEKPATLDEAYLLIESMRSTATRSFFRFLREGNLDGVKEQCRIGADLFAREEGTDLTCLEVVADMRAQLYAEKRETRLVNGKFIEEVVDSTVNVNQASLKKSIRDQVAVLDEVSQWLRLQGADASVMFYLMAVNGDEAGIVRSREYCSINTCDEHGHTAVDLALEGGKFDVARLLHRHGGVPNARLRANSKLTQAINCFCDPEDYGGNIKLIIVAIEVGLSYKTRVKIPSPYGPGCDEYCSLYAASVRFAQYDMLEACLKKGADANEILSFDTKQSIPGYGEEEVPFEEGSPWSILSKRSDMKGEKRQKFRELLQRYGARIDEE